MSVFTKQQRIAALAKRSPQMAFTSLAYLMDIEWLHEAFHRTRKDGATGVDGQTWADYAKNLEANLQSLLDRAKSGTYRAPPVRRVYIPKGGSTTETRPIGIPTLEDKVLQRAVVMLLEPIYEQDFHPGSYGFRRGRSAHQALEDLWQQTMKTAGGWILEVDIRKFFDTLDHGHLRALLRRRVLDGVLTRLIGKWLKAGVMEDGSVSYPDAGSPQGGVISPILANVYLHYVLDEWFLREVQPRLRGRGHLVRYADDFVILFTNEKDAYHVREMMPQRFESFGLAIHPEKTRLVRFHHPCRKVTGAGGDQGPGTFDLLGFTHYWGKGRQGEWLVKRKTAGKRLARAVRSIAQWCRKNRHRPVGEQRAKLCSKIRGHYAYYGITNNYRSLAGFLAAVQRVWRKWLDRRNSRHEMDWERFKRLLARYALPAPRIVHSYVNQRNHGLRNRMA
jgi:group II intron reverse transcriptase/maturase